MMYARDPLTGTNALRATTRRGGEPSGLSSPDPARLEPPEVLDSGGGAFLDSTRHHAHPGLVRSTHSARVQAKCLTYIHLLKAGS